MKTNLAQPGEELHLYEVDVELRGPSGVQGRIRIGVLASTQERALTDAVAKVQGRTGWKRNQLAAVGIRTEGWTPGELKPFDPRQNLGTHLELAHLQRGCP